MPHLSDQDSQEREWEVLYRSLEDVMRQFGHEDSLGRGDYWIVDDNWGCCQHKLYINNLNLLAPRIIEHLQEVLEAFPHWEIVVAVDLSEAGKTWPAMGLIIRPNEIIDGLQRAYFPNELRQIKYTGSKSGPVLNEP